MWMAFTVNLPEGNHWESTGLTGLHQLMVNELWVPINGHVKGGALLKVGLSTIDARDTFS